MSPTIIVFIAFAAWGAAMAFLAPQAWRLDKNRQRKQRHAEIKRLSTDRLKLRVLRMETAKAA